MSVRFCDVVRYIQNCDMSDLEALKEEIDFHLLLSAPQPPRCMGKAHPGAICSTPIEPRDFRGNVVSCTTLETFNAYRAWMAEVV